MIENEVKTAQNVTTKVTTSNTTSPIGKNRDASSSTKANSFLAWLNDNEDVDANENISAKTASTSFAKGLIEIVKTVYKKPILSAITISTGAVLTYFAHYSALSIVMGLCIGAGIAGIGYGLYSAITKKSGLEARQSYELMGISSFVLAIGVYGFLI